MIKNTDPVIAKAEALLEHLGSLDEVRLYYELREKEIHDEVSRMAGAREEGKIEGKVEGKLETAKNLLLMGFDIQNIAKATGLDIAQIQGLKRDLKN